MQIITGHGEVSGPRGIVKEIDTYTCAHCNRIRTASSSGKGDLDPGGVCRKCMAPICSLCLAKKCLSFEKRLDLYERKHEFLKAIGLEL